MSDREDRGRGKAGRMVRGEGAVEIPRDGRPIYEMRLRVRHYEMDALGHVNNAVYLNYLEQAAIDHADAMGFGAARLAALGGLFVVRRHEIEYFGAAVGGDELVVTTWPETVVGARAVRSYQIGDAAGTRRLVAARTLWVWIDRQSGRPRPVPREIVDAFATPGD